MTHPTCTKLKPSYSQVRGLALDRYMDKIVESRPAEQPISQQKTRSISEAIDRILELREDSDLGGLSIKALINERREH